jgi:hypothetical protein
MVVFTFLGDNLRYFICNFVILGGGISPISAILETNLEVNMSTSLLYGRSQMVFFTFLRDNLSDFICDFVILGGKFP